MRGRGQSRGVVSPISRGRRTLFQALLVLTPLAVPLATEIWLRARATRVVTTDGTVVDNFQVVTRGPRGPRLVPSTDVIIRRHRLSHEDIRMRINAHGFRGPEVPSPKPEGERRVLVLGDSITWADYLGEDEAYVTRVADHLADALGEPNVRVINGGVADVGLEDEVNILEEQGLALDPDVVLIAFYLNDSRPPWGFPGELGRPGWLRQRSLLADKLYHRLHLARWFAQQGEHRFGWVGLLGEVAWRTDPAAFAELAYAARFDWGATFGVEAWPGIDRQLDRVAALAIDHGFAWGVVAIPVRYQVEAEHVADEPQRQLERRLRDRGVPFLDLLPAARGVAATTLTSELFFDHCHPRANLNEVYGREIAQFVHDRFLSAPAVAPDPGG